ncbi:MAG: class I SAM-dependent methyltransferase [Bacteroidales bacterium]|nr:class I SAM-dependent methyltransferase [Bacteroidales bacterium]
MKTKNGTWFSNHSHSWIVIISASILTIIFINWLPKEKIFPSILIGLVASHTLILLVTIFGGWLLLPEKILKKFRRKKSAENFDFGWSSKWNKGFGIASLLVALLAFYSYYGLAGSPILQIIAFTLLLLLAVNLFIGNIIAKASNSTNDIILPYVDLFKAGKENVLDAGCGAGRTTISISKTASDINIIAFDRFDANYIDDGGKALFKHNIELAGISSRVKIEQGDITSMPFNDNNFEAAVSAYMFDHLGENKLLALKEMWRVLKPGGRFLLIIMVRGYSSFAIANVLSFVFATRNDWKKLFQQSDFVLIDEGNINLGAYFLIEKPLK